MFSFIKQSFRCYRKANISKQTFILTSKIAT